MLDTKSAEGKRALYAAFESHDTRFDGQVFVGVSSTGIYCRTVCSAPMPKFENCTFFTTAAEAEAAGFRPCMTCRPELAPGNANVDASTSLARRAAALIREECASGISMEKLAGRLGYTGRHLRRVFTDELGVTPVQYQQTCKLLLAKSLLTDSGLPIAQIAAASGFGSVRRFNHLFKERYRMTPSDLRKRKTRNLPDSGEITLRLGYRPPYRFENMLEFFRSRALEGVEVVDGRSYARTVRVDAGDGTYVLGWLRVENDARRNALLVTISDTLLPAISLITARVRRQFDVDCSPQAITPALATLEEIAPGCIVEGRRLPGCFDPFETACRAILGQQVSVKAANRLAARIVSSFGAPVETGIDGLTHAFPSPSEVRALEPLANALGPLGVIRTRSQTIAEIAGKLETGELDLSPSASVAEQMDALLSIKGIGPWSANYIAMRTMGYPDAFLESDVGVAHVLRDRSPKERLALSEQWRPWRSYAVINMWSAQSRDDA